MYLNIIGPPGSGKSSFIMKVFKKDYYKFYKLEINEFEEQKQNKIFEHTGHNSLVNSFLCTIDEDEVITVLIEKNIFFCLLSCLRDKKTRKIIKRFLASIRFFCKRNKMMTRGLVIEYK